MGLRWVQREGCGGTVRGVRGYGARGTVVRYEGYGGMVRRVRWYGTRGIGTVRERGGTVYNRYSGMARWYAGVYNRVNVPIRTPHRTSHPSHPSSLPIVISGPYPSHPRTLPIEPPLRTHKNPNRCSKAQPALQKKTRPILQNWLCFFGTVRGCNGCGAGM